MKKYDKLIFTISVCFIILLCMTNMYASKMLLKDDSDKYRVSINRIKKEIVNYEQEVGKPALNLHELIIFANSIDENKGDGIDVSVDNWKNELFPNVISVASMCIGETDLNVISAFYNSEDESVYFNTDEYCYRISYEKDKTRDNDKIIGIINIVVGIMFLIILSVLLYIRFKVIKPFNHLAELPYELSKGNLSIPLKEDKNRFFGKYMWGMDLLREKLEENKKRELELQREKKMLLLSLSHDIKTPLSAIKLYSKALGRNLYNDENRKAEVIANISNKVDEIENYISEIVKASNDDFLVFEVENDELYIKDVLGFINEYYTEKMQLNNVEFSINKYSNSIVYGDVNRLIEVLQNVIENAIKYGDGKKIWIETYKEDDGYVISVKNTGCTLKDRELVHIFDSFFRGSNVTNQSGSGLGLYICRELMHLMEGEITANIEKNEKDRIMVVNIIVLLI